MPVRDWSEDKGTSSMSIQNKLGGLFIVFFLLVAISVSATYIALRRQSEDALVINLAGRQRMLIQAMTRYTLEIERHPDDLTLRDHLHSAMKQFDATLTALAAGGSAPYVSGTTVHLPPAPNPDVYARLMRVRALWSTMRPQLERVLSGNRKPSGIERETVTTIERESTPLVAAMDDAVRAFERAATAKIRYVIYIQILFLSVAALLVLVGYTLTHRHIIAPIRRLESRADEMGQGRLETPVPALGHDEIGQLAQSLEKMRRQLYRAREDLEFQVAQRTRELEALYEVSRDISSRLEVEHVLRSVTEKARELLGADIATLCMLDASGATLQLQAFAGDARAVRATASPKDEPLAATVLSGECALRCSLCKGWCHVLETRFQADHMAASLRAGSRVIGALCVGSTRPGRFSPESEALLTRLANSAAVALENARLYEQAERVAALEERQRIAADMHDSVAQTLSYLALRVEQIAERVTTGDPRSAASDLERLRDQLDRTLQEVRTIIADLQRPALVRQNFQNMLERLVSALSVESSFSVTLDVCTSQPVYLPPDTAEQVLRVTREALLNALHHASPSSITVRFGCTANEGVVVVEDDGRGFDLNHPPQDGQNHFGLKIMKARAAHIRGTLTIEAAPGRGTRVRLAFPLPDGTAAPFACVRPYNTPMPRNS